MRFLYTLLTFAAAIVAQQSYARLVAPLIEPEFRVVVETHLPTKTGATASRDSLLPWFRPGDWELDPLNKLLETPDGILILRTYRNQPDGTVELHPCTMVFLPREDGSPVAERQAKATILQAPQGAVLRLDSPLDLKTGAMGRLQGGRLAGEVTIRSDNRDPGPEDDLFIRTHDVEMNGPRLITDAEVNFRLGGRHGHGRRLRIELLPGPPKAAGPTFAGIKTLELLERVWMHVEMGPGLLRGPGAKPAAAAKSAAPGTPAAQSAPAEPVEIACRGRFRFDAEGRSATFYDDVRVTRLAAQGARSESDQLQGDVLQLFFRPPAPKSGAAPAQAPGAVGKLEFERLLAVGRPVVVLSPSRQMEGRGGTLEWREADRTIRLDAVAVEMPGVSLPKASPNPPPAVLIQGGSEIQAKELICEMAADGGLAQARALGAGQLRADGHRPGGGQGEPLSAQWTKSLLLAPEGELQLLTLTGDAQVSLPQSGRLRGDEIFVWFLEQKQPARPVPPRDAGSPLGNGKLEPQKLAARGKVHLEASGLTADVEQLQVWFDHRLAAATGPRPAAGPATVPAGGAFLRPQSKGVVTVSAYRMAPSPAEVAAAAAAGLVPAIPYPTTDFPTPAGPLPGTAPAAGQPAPGVRPPSANKPAAGANVAAAPLGNRLGTRKFQVQGKLMRARIVVLGSTSSIGELWLEGQMQIEERDALGPPVTLTGDTLHAIEDDPRGATVRLTGQPAKVVGEGLSLTGSTIHLERTANRMWVEGAGRLTLPARKPSGAAPSPTSGPLGGSLATAGGPLEVRWDGGMTFDGLAGRFTQGVVAQIDARVLRTSDLRVGLTERVEFGRQSDAKPEVETVACPSEFALTGKTIQNGVVSSTDEMTARDLALNQRTGAVSAKGPGVIVQVRQGGEDRLGAARGAKQPGAKPAAAKPARAGEAQAGDGAAAPPQLMYLRVRFQGELTGNLHAKETTFTDQVESLYGPVANWDETLSADDLRPDDLWLACQRLTVRQSPTQGAQYSELEALTDVRVRGRQYQAWGGRLTYDEAKDLLILEGDNRTDAQLWRQIKLGGDVDRLNARKIYFWPATNHVKFEGVGGAELGGLSR